MAVIGKGGSSKGIDLSTMDIAGGADEKADSKSIANEFDGAIAKVQGAPKKAQKKIPQDTLPRLQANKQQSVSQTEKAKQTEESAKGQLDGDPNAREVGKGGDVG